MTATRGRFKLLPPRWRDEAWELRCRHCGDWWPMTTDFYTPRHGCARCNACWSEYYRTKEAARRALPESETGMRLTRRAKYFGAYHERRRVYMKAWRDANKDRVREYNRIYRERARQQAAA